MPHTTTENIIKGIDRTEIRTRLTYVLPAGITDPEWEVIINNVETLIASSLTKLSESIKREMLENAPSDKFIPITYEEDEKYYTSNGFNLANKEWREIINNLGEKGE